MPASTDSKHESIIINRFHGKEMYQSTHTRAVLSLICVGIRVNPDKIQQEAHTNAGTIDKSRVLQETTTAPTIPATKNITV